MVYFNSHAHVERDSSRISGFAIINDFNSHAHVERDVAGGGSNQGTAISTHTLTWSVTNADETKFDEIVISTHTLTWSVTC